MITVNALLHGGHISGTVRLLFGDVMFGRLRGEKDQPSCKTSTESSRRETSRTIRLASPQARPQGLWGSPSVPLRRREKPLMGSNPHAGLGRSLWALTESGKDMHSPRSCTSSVVAKRHIPADRTIEVTEGQDAYRVVKWSPMLLPAETTSAAP